MGAHSKVKFADDHIWLSIFFRPPRSRFTRAQRLTCCMVFLLTTMLVSAMWYDKVTKKDDGIDILGLLTISYEELAVALMSNIIMFPINFVIIFLFRFSRNESSEALLAKEDKDGQPLVDQDEDELEFYGRKNPMFFRLGGSNCESQSTLSPSTAKRKTKQKFSLPPIFNNVAWLLSFGIILTCAFFLTGYAIQMGNEKTARWMGSLVVSFATSVFFTQPLKIVLIVLFISCITKKDSSDEVDEDDLLIKLNGDKTYEYVHKLAQKKSWDRRIFLTAHEKERCRTKRLHDLKMYDALREIIAYVFFLALVFIIANRDYNVSLYRFHLGNLFGERENHPNSLKKIRDVRGFLNWTKNTLVPNLRTQPWYNGQPPIGQLGFFSDRVSRILGFATMRQIRSKGNCSVQPIFESVIKNCYRSSQLIFEDNDNYSPGWERLTDDGPLMSEFLYIHSQHLGTYPFYGLFDFYSGGGYVVDLVGTKDEIIDNFDYIVKKNWIDERTRAVIVEFSAYNAFANLFAYCRISFEFPVSGGVIVNPWFQPMKLFRYQSRYGLILRFCEGIFYLYTLSFIIKEGRTIRKIGFFVYVRLFWSWVEMCIVCLAIAGSLIFLRIRDEAKRVSATFAKSNGNQYVSLASIAALYQSNEIIVAFMSCLAIFKFIKIIRFNRHISTVNAAFKLVKARLASYGLIVVVVFMSFTSAFYLSMNSTLDIYRSMGSAARNSFEMLLGKYDFNKMQQSNKILAPFFLVLFCIAVAIVMLNLCITILMETFKQVRSDSGNHSDDYEIWLFIVEKFKKALFGRKEQVYRLDVGQKANDFTLFDKLDYQFNLMTIKINRLFHQNKNVSSGEKE